MQKIPTINLNNTSNCMISYTVVDQLVIISIVNNSELDYCKQGSSISNLIYLTM